MSEDRELRPVGRFEWEQIIRRARFTGLIGGSQKVGKTGKQTRGGVSGAAFKAVALVWATHGNPDGTEVYPGDATLAVEAEVGLKVAQAVKAKLIELGLTERTRAGARRLRRSDVYRLTLPTDLLDVVEVLTPDALKTAAVAEYEKQRGKRGGSVGPPKGPIDTADEQGPLDPPEDDGEQGPSDPPQPDPDEICGGSDGPTKPGCGGSDGTVVGGPTDRDTNPRPCPSLPTPTHGDVRTDLTGPRATRPEEPDSDVVDEEPEPEPGPLRLVAGNPDATATTAPRGIWPALVADDEPEPAAVPAEGHGFCVPCHTAGQYVLAADPDNGSQCAYHLRSA